MKSLTSKEKPDWTTRLVFLCVGFMILTLVLGLVEAMIGVPQGSLWLLPIYICMAIGFVCLAAFLVKYYRE